MSITVTHNSFSFNSFPVDSQSANISSNATGELSSNSEQRSGVHVDLSNLGQALSMGLQETQSTKEKKLANIDESGLPDAIKEILKRIVELQQQLKEKQNELQKIMQDQSLSPEERQQKSAALQKEMSTLQSALGEAMSLLSKTMQETGIDKASAMEIASLISF